MRLVDDRLRVSASDASNFLACRHLTRLDAASAHRLLAEPNRKDVGFDALVERGRSHEADVLESFRSKGWSVREIDANLEDLATGDGLTRAAIADDVDVIYQGVLVGPDRLGLPDFLVRAELLTPESKGYEVVDAKLARTAKARAVLQTTFYSRLLADLQGFGPERMHLALGGAEELASFRVADFAAYERQVDRMLEAFLGAGTDQLPPPDTYPDPNEHCAICRWYPACIQRRRADDDLSLIAGITSRQRKALKAYGIERLEAFASLHEPPMLERVGRTALAKTHKQARLQLEARRTGERRWEFVEPGRDDEGVLVPNRGLLALPLPTDGDLFFDIEGARFYSEDGKEFGLQYLFGFVDAGDLDDAGRPRYTGFWAFDRAGEKRAFEEAVDFISERLERRPGMRVYHYNHYEPTSVDRLSELHETREAVVGRLMGRFAAREDEVDDLFRRGVFVDLYRVVRQGIRASVESYSIKRLEPFCGYKRAVDLPEVNEQMVLFEVGLDDATAAADTSAQELIAGYNEDDCRATLALRDWLETLRLDLESQLGEPLPRLVAPEEPEDHADPAIADLREKLLAGLPEDETDRLPEERARALAADLLEWHRREDKPKWWRWFHLLTLSDEELLEEPDAISGLEFDGIVGEVARSNLLSFRFPPQEHPFDEGRHGFDRDDRPWTIWEVDDAGGRIVLKRGKQSEDLYPTCLIERTILQTPEQRARIRELAERVLAAGVGPSSQDAALDLLLRRPPTISGNEPLRLPGETSAQAGRRLAPKLDRSYLPIQGPPGTGKTYTGALQIVELVTAHGQKVGVTATSHAVIANLLDAAAREAESAGVVLRIGQKPDSDQRHVSSAAADQDHVFSTNPQALKSIEGGEIDVLGGTTWLWAREDFRKSVDLLIVDEASQMSLANVLSVCHAARNVVLLGDPQQLGHPNQAAQPPGADASALGHVLGEHATMPFDRGLFIEHTRRMHPDVCGFTSEVFYEGRLRPIDGLEKQLVIGEGVLSGTGLRLVPVDHEGNANDSPEEAEVVARIVGELLGRSWRDREGKRRKIGASEVLVVTPFNAQIREIQDSLEQARISAIRVGTVDKFQGQEAPVVIYSMASSSAEEAPRGVEFLYDLHRLNVATSRARCLAILVASPDLMRVFCTTPRQMVLANALCRFCERAASM